MAILFNSCDPEPSAGPVANGLSGEWEMISTTGLVTTTTYSTSGSETNYVDVRMIEPTSYRVTFTEDPRRATSSGAATLERTARNGSNRDTIASSGNISGMVSWELDGLTLTLEDEDGFSQEMLIKTLDELELSFSYDVIDSTFMPYFLTRSQATQTYVRR